MNKYINAKQIIEEAKSIHKSNDGIKALVKRNYCIMDELYSFLPYKDEGGCLDYKKCDCEDYMLACFATREPEDLANWVIESYNIAMNKNKK